MNDRQERLMALGVRALLLIVGAGAGNATASWDVKEQMRDELKALEEARGAAETRRKDELRQKIDDIRQHMLGKGKYYG